MKYVIKRIDNKSYFQKHLFKGFNHYTNINEARKFKSKENAIEVIKKYKLEKVEILKCMK